MDYSVAEMNCVLSASVQCEACKAKVQEILQNIYGLYTITMDSDDGTVRICGRVNPRSFLKVIEKSGKHAEVRSIRFDGEAGDRRYNTPYGDDHADPSFPRPYQNCRPEQSQWLAGQPPMQPYPMMPQQPMLPYPWPMMWPRWPNPEEMNQDNNNNNDDNNQKCCTVM